MWMKRKQFFQSSMTTTNPFNSSCEEQAFVDGHLGGFIWRPRSHSCSFCKREFSSAQALGGHMNVHRRDRARLQQSLSVVTPQQSQVFHHPCNNNKSSLDLDYASYPSQLCFLDSNPNPSFVASTSPHSPSRVSAIFTTQENLSEPTTYVSPFSFSSSSSLSSSSIVQDEHLKGFPHSSLPMPRSDSEAVRLFNDSDSKTAFEKNPRKEVFETNLSMGSNLVASQNRLSGFDCDDHQIITLKRHKSTVSSMPVLHKQCSSDDRYHFQSDSQVLEDLDLELRLGLVNHPKVK